MTNKDMTYEKISNNRLALIMLGGGLMFMLFALDGQSGRGMVAALSTCAILAVVTIVRAIAHGPRFWTVVVLIALAHALLVFIPQWPDFHFAGIGLAPLVIADMYACARILIFAGAPKGA
jgi:hypothetical protein